MTTSSCRRRTCAVAAVLACVAAAHATEGGGLAAYPDGLENFLTGALPPPGVHTLLYGAVSRYTSLRGNDGERVGPPDFKVEVNALVPRVVWVTGQQVLGGQLAFEALLPLLDVSVLAGGATFGSTGAGDLVLGTAVGWHHGESLHSVAGLDVYLPTGDYDATDPSSLGKHTWTFQPVYAVSRIDPNGWNGDVKLMWDVNRRNSDTRTRSGQALHADFAAGWGFGQGWVAGVGGHTFQQITDDDGPAAAAGKARAWALGPSVRYATPQGFLVTAKLQREFGVRNRLEGTQFLVKATLPF